MRSVERKVPTATAQTIEPPRPRVEHEPRALALTPGKRNLIEDGDDAPAAAPGKRNGARAWSAAELLDAASLDELIPLPHRAAIERRLHVDLGGVRARSGPRSRKALAALGAVAAQRGRELAFASSAPSLAVVMHEVMHVLQSAQGAGSGLAPEDSLAEREADAALTRLPRAPLAGPRRTPAEAGRALALSPAAAEVHLLRIRQVEGIWSIVDDHDAQGIDPATLDDPGRVDVIANLLLAKRLSVAQRVLLAAPDEAWRRILAGLEKDRASPGAEQLIAVLSSFLQSPIIDGVKGASRDVRARIALRAAEQGASPDTLVKLEHVLEVLSHDALLLDAEFVKKLIDHGECVSAVYMEAFKIWFKSFVEEAADERVDISKLGPRALLDLARLYPGLGGTLAAWAVQEARGYVDTVEQLLSYVVGDNQRAGAIVEAAYSERKEELALCYLPAMGRALAVDLAQTALRRVVQADCFTTKMFELLSTEVLARSDSKLFSMLTPLLLELKIALGQVDHGKSKVDYSKTFGCYLDADPGFALRVFGHGQQVLLEVLDQIDQLVLATGFHLGWFRIFPMVARVATRFGMTVEDLLAAALEDSDEPHAAAQALADALGEDLHIIVDTGGKLPNVSMSVYERIRDLIGTALHYLSKTARIQINDPNDAPRFLQILDFFQRSGHQYYRNQGGAMDAIYAQALGQVHPELKRLELGALQAAPRFVSGDFGAVLSKSFFIVRVRGTPDQLQLELDFKALMESFFHLQGALAGVQGDLVFDLTEILPKLDEKNHHGCADRLFALTEQFIVEVANRYQREHKESKGDKKKTPYDRMVKKLQNGFIRLCGFVTVDNQRLFYNFGIPGPKGAKVEEDEDGASEPEEGPKPAAKSRSGALTFYKAPLQGDKVGKLRERGYVPDILDFKLRLFDVLTSGNDLSNLRSFVDPFLLGGLGARSRERNQRVTRGGVIAQLELCRKMVHCEPSAPFVKRHYFEAFNRFFATLIAQLREPAELDDEYVPSSPETPATPFLPTADEMEGFSEEQQELGRKNTVFDEERVSTAPMFAPSGPEEQLVDRFVLDVLIDVTDQLAQLSLMPAVEGAQYNAFCDLTEGVLEDLLHVMSLHDFFPGSSATGYLEQVADDLYELDETDGLEPQFYVFNGGLHAITEVLLLAIDQKRRAKQGGELQIRYSNNVYFELIRMITKELRDVCALPYVRSPNRDTKLRARVLDGDTIEERLGTLPLKQLNALFTKLTQEPLPATREERVQGLESFGMEVTKALIDLDDPETDLIMFDIYPNDSVKSHVSKNDPVAILKRILDAPKRNKPLTAIIDTTMNFFSDEETRRLVADPRIKDAIAKGQLNLFLVNSLVKYANQGWDKFTSGLMVSFANEDAEGMQQRAAWHEFLADSTHALDGFLQLVFRSLHTGEQGTPLEETSLILSYLQQIRDNADYLAEQISERLLGKKGGSFIQLGGRDQGLPYLSFQFDAIDELYTDEELRKHDPCKPGESSTRSRKAFRENIVVVFVYYLVACASKRSDGRTPLTFRSSFGFARSNLGPTAHTLRLTPGLEERACLDDYVNLIDQFNDELEAFFGDKKNCALILEVVRAGDRTVKPMQTARNRAAIVREFKRAKDYSFHTFMQIVQKYNQPGERNDKEEEDDDGSSRDSNRGGRGRGERKPRPAYVTRKLEGADGSTLTVLSTLGDGDCGIHAMTGTVDPLWGQMREKAPDKLRKQLADAIEKGQVDARKYAALIAELLRALLIKKASGTACTADQTIMWSVIEKNGPLCEALYDAVGADREQMHALGQQREILLKRLLKLIRSAEPAARPLQLALIGEINASNAESDLTLQALFLSLDGAEDPCIALLGSIDESELRDAVESNFDLLHQILGMGGTNVDEFLGYQKSAAQTGNGLLAFVTKWLEHLLPAYAPCVRRRGYYLRQEDLELLAQILGRPLVLVREDDRQPGMFVRVTPAPTVPEVNPLYVFHSGAHFEHAELTLPPKNQ